MALVTGIPIVELSSIIDIIFATESAVTIYEAYSDFDSELQSFSNKEELNTYFNFKLTENDYNDKIINLTLHYHDMSGDIFIEKLNLDANACAGATFRYTADGWGAINSAHSY